MKDRKAENSKNENPLFFKSVAHFLHQAGGNVDFYPPSHPGTELEGTVHHSGDIMPKVGQALSSLVSL